MENYLEQLNEQQRAAVEYCDGPQLVIAGAGSGKTRVLTYKIVYLLHQGLHPYRIMALTFTNKAAREMRERIEGMVDADVARQLWMGTFHSIFARLLRVNAERLGFRHDFTIYDTTDSRSLLKLIIGDLGLDEEKAKAYKPATIQNIISNMKNALISPDDYAKNPGFRAEDERANRPLTYAIYQTYCDRCRVAGAMDFDDLLYYTNILLRDFPDVLERYQQMFQYILVDEYQDTNFAQHMIVLQLSRAHNRLCVVGDDAQSIYSFRGANIDNILKLRNAYPDLQTFKLERNYRSTQTIINAANSLIEKNERQIAKHIFSENALGDRIAVIQCFSDYEEAYVVANQIASIKARQGDSYEDFAILYRTNAQSRVLEEALSNGGRRDKHGNMRHAIPYRIYGGLSFYQRKEIKDAVCYFRLLINPDDDEALRRVINTPARGIGDTTVGKLIHCAMERGVSIWQVVANPDAHQLTVNNGTKRKLEAFAQLIQGLATMNAEGKDAFTMAKAVIDRTHMLSILMNDKTPENISRQENLSELLNGVKSFVDEKLEQGIDANTLGDFLAEVSLLTDQDTADPDGEKVTLMTVHAAKGLEFKNVIIVGVEEDLFPSALSNDSMSGIEEERRLFYVAITRAKVNCVITYATSRYQNGMTRGCTASRFLRDIDPQFLQSSATSSSSGNSRTGAFRRRETVDFDEERHSWFPKPEHTPSPGRESRNSSTAPQPTVSRATTRPAPPAVRHSYENPSAFDSSFRLHKASELSVGMHIHHTHFGHGVIETIDTSGNDDKVIIQFDDSKRTLLLKFARFKVQ
ncbi:MAG: UvrD-helicase domain-containing protein [Muribaculaceae bacterium]|nr:UvrD-helicase domain-containing protein [Muribaculaceae bacterium]